MPRLLLLLILLLLAPLAHAQSSWWNAEWQFRKKITLNTTEQGANVKEPVATVAVPVRLHIGNFLFTDAKPDGSDIRFVASDDKTPLKHTVEVFDSANQLAILWVQLPRVTAATANEFFWMYSGNAKAAAIDDPKGTFGGSFLFLLPGGRDAAAVAQDRSTYNGTATLDRVAGSGTGIIGNGLLFQGGSLRITPAARAAAAGGFTFSGWFKPAAAQDARLFAWGPVLLELKGDQLIARSGTVSVTGGALKAGEWTHVAVAASSRLVLYVGGNEVAAAAIPAVEYSGEVVIGAGFAGEADHLALADVARAPGWIKLESAHGMDGRLLAYGEPETTAGDSHASYFKVLVDNLTLDAWIVIVILMIMMVISFIVMFLKAAFLARTGRANEEFLEQFDRLALNIVNTRRNGHGTEILSAIRSSARMEKDSSLFRMYATAVRELGGRTANSGNSIERNGLSPQTLESIRASVDATLVRERQRLDSKLVLLTISISGGPFLGLLGTVVGVMIVFAAVAAAGDVNINAIAPGIAAALLATVAGLAVAIPCLFGYNYLASRVKAITADMQVFSDVITTRLAERFAPSTPYSLEAAE